MTHSLSSVNSTDVVLYHPPISRISQRTRLEAATNEIYRRSLEIAKFESSHLLPKWKERVVCGVAAGVSRLYVDQIRGERMASVVRQNLRLGKYDAHANPTALNQAVLQDLYRS